MSRNNRGPQLGLNKNGVWEIRWTVNGRSQRLSTRTENLREAQQVFAGFLIEYEEDRTKGRGDPRVADVLDEYLEGHVRVKVADPVRYENILATLREGLPDQLRVSEIQTAVVDRYLRARRSGAILGGKKRPGRRVTSEGTLRLEITTLKAALEFARKRGWVDKAPHIELPAGPERREKWLTKAEVEAMVEHVRKETAEERMGRSHRFVLLAVATGARRRSIETLTWAQIDLDRKLIRFDLEEGRQRGRRTKKRRVPVPIADWLMPWLERARGEQTGDLFLDNDSPITPSFQTLMKRTAAASGNPHYLDMNPHALRHTAGTLMAQAGVDLYTIAGILGDTVATVTQTYLHHAPEHLRAGVDALGFGAGTPAR